MSDYQPRQTVVQPQGTVRWFGADWGAPVCYPGNHVATPIGTKCVRCGEKIGAEDQGVTMPELGIGPTSRAGWHLECWLAEVVGPSLARRMIGNPHE